MESLKINRAVFLILARSFLGLAFMLFIATAADLAWGVSNTNGNEYTIGLWKNCTKIMNLEQQCLSLKCPQNEGHTAGFCNKILTARAFVTLACIMSGISAVLLFTIGATSEDKKQISLIAAKGLTSACLIMAIIGVAVGINGTTQNNYTWGAAAILGIIGIILNLCGATATVAIKYRGVTAMLTDAPVIVDNQSDT